MIGKLELIHLYYIHMNYLLYLSWFCTCFHRHAFNDSWNYFEVLQMAPPRLILLLSVIGRSWGGAKELIIVSLIITSFVSACLDPSKLPSSGEAMTSLWNYHMENSSKSFVTFRFTPDSASVISKVSRAIGDSRTFDFFHYPLN